MGQCAVTPPTCGTGTVLGGSSCNGCDGDYDEYDGVVDDVFSVVATPHNQSVMAFSSMESNHCNVGGDDEEIHQQGKRSTRTAKKTFLKVHRPDIIQRSIIDPNEVLKVLSLQAEELLCQKQLIRHHNDETLVVNVGNQVKVLEEIETVSHRRILSDTSSLVSGTTGITTASRSTIVAGNTGREYIKSSNNHSKLELTPAILESVVEKDLEVTAVKGNTNHGYKNSLPDKDETTDSSSLIGQIMAVATSFNSHPATMVDVLRNQYMSVLRLKMKANFAQFYSQRYLKMFPNALILLGPKFQSPGSVPDLTALGSSGTSSSFSSSSSEGNVESYNGTYKTTSSDYVHYGNLPPSKPIKCSVTKDTFLDLAVTGSLGMLGRLNERSKSGSESSQSQRHYGPHVNHLPNQKRPDHYIVLINRRSGYPLAVCALKSTPGSPVVRIYTTRRRVFNQKQSTTTRQLGLEWAGLNDMPLYAWAELVCDGEFPDPVTFHMYMARGSKGRFATDHSYEAIFYSNTHANKSQNESDRNDFMIQVKGRTDLERQLSGCALLTCCSEDDGSTCFNIDVSQGIDPALLICFTAIVDDIIEASMRKQCKAYARSKIQNAKKKLSGSR